MRMFGNRLGNCAYDKNFLKDIKNVRPNSANTPITPPFRPANYPRIPKNTNHQANSFNSLPPPQLQSNQSHIHTTTAAIPHPIVKSPLNIEANTIAFDDDSMFENSMMISEEDLIIGSDDNFGLHDSVNNSSIYPILPNKRK